MKKACIISIGNELLNGRTLDTNAQWVSIKLLEMGIPTEGIWVVGDEIERITACLKQAAQAGDLVIITGGLGPTDDDLTRLALAEFMGVPLEFHPELMTEIEAFFNKLNVRMADINCSQAYIPKGAAAIHNPIGTAPGMHAQYQGKMFFCMPGVPVEMKSMFKDSVYPVIRDQQSGPVTVTGRLYCYGAGESTIATMLGDRMKRGRNPLLNCTVSGGDISLHVVAEAPSFEMAQTMIAQQKQEISAILGNLVYSTTDQSLPEVVGSMLKQRKMTLATAESCTGGLVGKMITDISGSSDYYLGGWVTYSNEAKNRELDVPLELLKQHGAVSEPVALALAQGAIRKSGASSAIGITGIAGPGGGTEQKPVGLVYIAVITEMTSLVKEYRFAPLSRDMIRQRAALTSLNLLRLQLGGLTN